MMRSVQSANISYDAWPIRFKPFAMLPPAWPDWTRRSHAATVDENSPNSEGTSRVALFPSAWHAVHPPDLRLRSHACWWGMLGEIPLPLGPVPGNALLSGTSISESQ